jgi:hypothetical protein
MGTHGFWYEGKKREEDENLKEEYEGKEESWREEILKINQPWLDRVCSDTMKE